MKLNRKILIILLFLFFFFLLSNTVFAYETSGLDSSVSELLNLFHSKGFITDEDLSMPYICVVKNYQRFYNFFFYSDIPKIDISTSIPSVLSKGYFHHVSIWERLSGVYTNRFYDVYNFDDYSVVPNEYSSNSIGYDEQSSTITFSHNFDVYDVNGNLIHSINDSKEQLSPPSPVIPGVPLTDIFKIHVKDLNCGIWRNFSLQFPEYSNQKYLLFLDTFTRNVNNCLSPATIKLKLYVYDDVVEKESYNPVTGFGVGKNGYLDYSMLLLNNQIVEDEKGYFAYSDFYNNIYLPVGLKKYSIYETGIIFQTNSSDYNLSDLKFYFVSEVDNKEYHDSLIYGDRLGCNNDFIGSNLNIVSFVEDDRVSAIEKILAFANPLNNIFKWTNDYYRVYKTYDYNYIKNYNSSCYGSNETFNNEYWFNYKNAHKHNIIVDSSGSSYPEIDVNFNSAGAVSGSTDYLKTDDEDNILNFSDVLEYLPIVQTPTNTDTYLIENEEGEKVENIGDISKADKDIIENTKNDTSSWGVLDFLKGLFSSLGNLLEFMKKALFSILEGILNIGEKILSLFIPDGDFWSNFSTDISSFLDEHLGLIFQPFEILGDVLDRYNNIEFVEPKLVIPQIKVPLTDYILLESREVYFSQVFEIEIMSYLHNIYL